MNDIMKFKAEGEDNMSKTTRASEERRNQYRGVNERSRLLISNKFDRFSDINEEGYAYKYVRCGNAGKEDDNNISDHLRNDWNLIEAKDHPGLIYHGDIMGKSEFKKRFLCHNDTVYMRRTLHRNNQHKELMANLAHEAYTSGSTKVRTNDNYIQETGAITDVRAGQGVF